MWRVKTIWVGLVLGAGAVVAAVAFSLFNGAGGGAGTEPWWGTPLFTLVGGMSGALIGGGFAVWSEAERRRVAERERLDARDSAVALEFLTAVNRYLSVTRLPDFDPKNNYEVNNAWAALQLNTEPAVYDVARRLLLATLTVGTTIATPSDHRSDDLAEAMTWFYFCHREFINLVRGRRGQPLLRALREPPMPVRVQSMLDIGTLADEDAPRA